MKRITPAKGNREGWSDNEYYAVEDEDGVMRCSCGRELIKMDEETYQCSGGYPIFRFAEGSVIIDKFGNLCIKKLSHKENEEE